MKLVITLRREVQSREQGEQLYELVRRLLDGHPDVEITGHVTNHFLPDELQPPS